MSVTEEDLGQIVKLPPEEPGSNIEELPEGGAIVQMEGASPQQAIEFYDNLVPYLDPQELEELAAQLCEDIKRDRTSRKEADDQYAEAIRRTGLGKEAPGGAAFEGSSRAVHPMLTEAAVDFASRAIREIMPSNGPVKSFIPGKNVTPDRLEKADRKKDYMNWQFIHQMPEFRNELEQLLTQLALGGSMYMRLVPDPGRKNRPIPTFVPLDDIVIPYSASNFYTAVRQTYVERLTQFDFDERVADGLYEVEGDTVVGQTPEQTEAGKASEKVEGKKDSSGYNEDGLKIVYETSTFHQFKSEDFNDGDRPRPYLICIDEIRRKIISVVRNWEEDDKHCERMQWITEFQLIPWRGAYAVGLGQMVGSLSGAATGALRALLDSGHVNNIPVLARLKGANFPGQSQKVGATEIIEVKGGVGADNDIRKLLMHLEFNEPSQVLYALLGFLTDAGKGMLSTALEKIAEGNSNMPVGTTLALIEEGMRVHAAIHLRLYHSMTRLLQVLHRIDRMYLEEDELQDDAGELLAYRKDFQDPLDVIPVADPEIFSDVQRMAQLQIIAERATALPHLYNARAVEKRLLERTKIPNIEELLLPQPKPEEMNAVNENVAMALGRPVAAFPDQDHLAHIQVLLDFLESPVLGSLPIIAPSFLPAALSHLKEHVVYWYVSEFYTVLQEAMGVNEQGIQEVMQERDPETRKELDRFLAVGSTKVIVPEAGQTFAQLPGVIQKAQQLLSQFKMQPQMPVDPNKMADVEAKREKNQLDAEGKKEDRQLKLVDIQSRTQSDAAKLASEEDQTQAELAQKREIEFAKLSATGRKAALDRAREEAQQAAEIAARLEELARKAEADEATAAANRRSKEQINTQDNLTALRIAAAEIESSEKVGLSTGTGIDQNPSGGRKR